MTPAVHPLRRVCVFCGSNRGGNPAYAAAAEALGRDLVRRGIGLVYGGGNVGLMGVLAGSVLQAGGHVIGVIPEALMARELGHRGIQDLRVVGTMHERKALMAELADGFIALPGGIGTFEEFFEILTWAQLGLHSKPCALLNVAGFFDPLLRLFEHAIQEQFVPDKHRSLAVVRAEIRPLLDAMTQQHLPREPKWIEPENV
ncbi:MAG TPA: TIGR00730 family Rossman fold protein [Candidatus Acidoferrum sp.]|nr:TIGR00730 family Rossman fold protein [Candidatus Acidoferrum sp.]